MVKKTNSGHKDSCEMVTKVPKGIQLWMFIKIPKYLETKRIGSGTQLTTFWSNERVQVSPKKHQKDTI